MSSIRRFRGTIKTGALGVLLLTALAGCEMASTQPAPAPLAPAPAADAATLRRNFAPMSAHYVSDQVVAGPTLFPFVAKGDTEYHGAAVVDPALFVANVAALPVMLFVTPPWIDVKYDAMRMPPTYAAAPPLPPTPQKPPEMPW